jgi:hypothetical protein
MVLCDGVFKECMEDLLIGYAVGRTTWQIYITHKDIDNCAINSGVLQYEVNSIQLTKMSDTVGSCTGLCNCILYGKTVHQN